MDIEKQRTRSFDMDRLAGKTQMPHKYRAGHPMYSTSCEVAVRRASPVQPDSGSWSRRIRRGDVAEQQRVVILSAARIEAPCAASGNQGIELRAPALAVHTHALDEEDRSPGAVEGVGQWTAVVVEIPL
jgi:hypothetical protein